MFGRGTKLGKCMLAAADRGELSANFEGGKWFGNRLTVFAAESSVLSTSARSVFSLGTTGSSWLFQSEGEASQT